ncbi:MAG TPA: hypothetical protein VF011_10545 [Terriglobales bacterium]
MRTIMLAMARGWESKAVEAQQAEASESIAAPRKPILGPEEKLKLQKRQGLLLDRKRVLQQLESIRNERYRKMLQDALTELDHRIATLG